MKLEWRCGDGEEVLAWSLQENGVRYCRVQGEGLLERNWILSHEKVFKQGTELEGAC